MLVGETEVNINEVTSIEYDSNTDLVTIEWQREYANSPVTMSVKIGRKAYGLKDFIERVIKNVHYKYNAEIEAYKSVLEQLE